MTLFNLRKKKSVSVKPSYPQTRELFLFVRAVLAERKGESDPSRLMDAEVGALLSYDYKYTHQWRFGKKRMFDASELEELATNADIPFELIQKVAIGIWDADQAMTVWSNRERNAEKSIQRTIKVNGVSLEVNLELPADRVDQADQALADLKAKIKARLDDPNALLDARQNEIKAFEGFVDDLDLPRVSFYRKSKS